MKTALTLFIALLVAGCSTTGGSGPSFSLPGSGQTKTFAQPIATVKPAFVSTLAQMGMPIAAIETRGGNEVVKARKADKNVEIEFERLGAASTRVRVTGSSDAAGQVMQETEKRLAVK